MLTAQQIERYSRQIILPEIGGRGQQRLLAAKVSVVGVTDIAHTVCVYLAAAGVGHLDIANGTAVTAAELTDLNPDCRINAHSPPLTPETADHLARNHDLVVAAHLDATTCNLINAACVVRHTPLLWAQSSGFAAIITGFAGHDPQLPCYACRTAPEPETQPAAFPLTAGLIGTMLATETVKRLLGCGVNLEGRRLTYDALAMTVREDRLEKNAHCIICQPAPRTPEGHLTQ